MKAKFTNQLLRFIAILTEPVFGLLRAAAQTEIPPAGVQHRGGVFIIPAQRRSAAVKAIIAGWQGQGHALTSGQTGFFPITMDKYSPRLQKTLLADSLAAFNSLASLGYRLAGITRPGVHQYSLTINTSPVLPGVINKK